MTTDPQIEKLALDLTAALARNTAQVILDRVRAARARKQSAETVEELNQIVNDLIEDKNNLIGIAQAYQAELVAQRLSANDIEYITKTVVPLVEHFAKLGGNGDPNATATVLAQLKPLLSSEMVNILQLLGFSFREAIGEPLTKLVADKITPASKAPELQALEARRQIALFELAQNEDAVARMQAILGQ